MNSKIMNIIGIDPAYYIIGILVLVIILFIITIVQKVKLSKLRKRLDVFMQGKEAESLEEQFKNRFQEIDEVKSSVDEHSARLESIEKFDQITYSKLGMVKYDAFKEMGGNMSFSLALLNEKNDGILMNSMHTREGCYTYIKEIIDGKSYIELSEEENEALDNAINERNYEKQI